MSVTMSAGEAPVTPVKSQPSINGGTYEKIVVVLTPKGKPPKTVSIEDLAEIQEIVENGFKDAAAIEKISKMKDVLIQQLTAKGNDLVQKIELLIKQNGILKSQCEALQTEKAQLLLNLNALQAQNNPSKAQFEELQKETEALKKQYKTLEDKWEFLKKEFDNLTETNKKAVEKSAQLNIDSAKLEEAYQKLSTANSELAKESGTLNQKYGELESQYKDLETETKKWSEKCYELNGKYAALQKVVNEALQNQNPQLDLVGAWKGVRWYNVFPLTMFNWGQFK